MRKCGNDIKCYQRVFKALCQLIGYRLMYLSVESWKVQSKRSIFLPCQLESAGLIFCYAPCVIRDLSAKDVC